MVVKSQPALTYASYIPQAVVPVVARTIVEKPTVVYDSPKRIIYRKITCYR